jgi:hypothetical protein
MHGTMNINEISLELSAMQFLPDVATGCKSQIYFKLDTSPFTVSTLMDSDELH